MVTEQIAEPMSNEEASAFATKLEAFELSLTPKERQLFQQILRGFEPLPTADSDEAAMWAGDAE
jgi:hypothetical protein